MDVTFLPPAVTIHSVIDQDKTRLLLDRFGVLATLCNYLGRSMLCVLAALEPVTGCPEDRFG